MNHRVPTILIAAALVASGCGDSGNNDDKPATSGKSSTASASQAPYGLYIRTVTKRDLQRTASSRDEHGPDQSLPPTGRYRLVIAKGAAQDVIKVTDPEGFTTDMDMKVTGDDLHLTSYVNPARAAFCGPAIQEGAIYSFQSSAASLELRPKSGDACADRDSMLTGTWAKS